MYCNNCGKEVNDKAVVCINCGCAIESAKNSSAAQATNDNGGIGWWLLGFLIPLVGLIVYLVFAESRPKTAKKAGSGALVKVILSIGFTLLCVIIYILDC